MSAPDRSRVQADDAIRRGAPVVIALGAEHYPLSFGYRKKNCKPLQRDKHEFFINNGQGGDFRWTTSSTWFVGEILTSSRPSSGFGACSGRGMKSCPNGCWNPSTPPHCVALDYQCPPDLCGGCPDNKRCCEPGHGPHPKCQKCIPKAGPYICP